MSAATATAAVEAQVFGGPKFFREDLPLEQLQPSPLNPRKRFDQAKLEELAQSILELGILEPLIVRPMGDHYEIVAGERRYRAAQIAGLTSVPAVSKPLTDAQVLEVMVVENNQREDVLPLEEAEGFSRLIRLGYDPERLADRIGRSNKYVYDRVKLLDLQGPAKQLLEDSRITAGHAILLARLKPEDQLRAIDPEQGGLFEVERTAAARDERDGPEGDDYVGMKARSVREFNEWLATHVRFDPVHMAQAAPLDFGEVGERVTLAAAKPGRGKKVIAITFEHFVQPAARDESQRTFGPQSWQFADGQEHAVDSYSGKRKVFPTCEHSVVGYVAAGVEQYGQAFEVCVARDKCAVHWKAEIEAKRKAEKQRESGRPTARQKEAEARERDEARRREEEEREKAARQQWQQAVPEIRAAVIDRIKGVKLDVLSDLLHDAFRRHARAVKAASAALFKRDPKTAEETLRVFALLHALEGHDSEYWGPREYPARAKRFGLDVAPILKKHASPRPVQTSARAKSGKGGRR